MREESKSQKGCIYSMIPLCQCENSPDSRLCDDIHYYIKNKNIGQVQWLTHIILTLWEAEVDGSLRSGVWDHPGQHGETPSLLKIQKISWVWWRVLVVPATWEASRIACWGKRITWTRETEVVVSWDRATAFQPG